MGMQVIHLLFLGIGFGVILNHPDYVKWPAQYSDAGARWFLSDNWECTLLFSMFAGQFLCRSRAHIMQTQSKRTST